MQEKFEKLSVNYQIMVEQCLIMEILNIYQPKTEEWLLPYL